ncbi:hypothetical protein N7474_008908 [Penicillium riverlandense]|uniref:uncharacterized protein n=1 Tax=Penicillium riverlandense TaxID=1903569 RepID=UPI0025479C03|nr:uncharacterized protein N7474_008908 [Penicillium riverlandense]KAJ5812607.1 hypothetical protein N7474_008908 [Penicillium riverlandense]
MLPPSDSLRHQAHKLAEARANRTGLPSAPPPYSQVPHVTMGGHSLLDMDEDDSPSPITITLDASIHVQGNGNTIVLPSTSAKAAEQHQQHNRISSSDSTAPSTSAQTTALQSAQKHRQNKLSEMASTIIAALREADALLDVESGRCRPIAVHLNAGVKIDGSRNVICVGAAAGPSRMGRKNLLSGDGEGVSRKRRAQSVCLFPF